MSAADEIEAIVVEVGEWLWGTVQGGFNEKQSISQIIVDAVIGMIPIVGDVTAARDLVAVILRMIEEPEKREDKLEWVTLVLLLFALIPVAGGAIKGVGKLVLKAAENGSDVAKVVVEVVKVLNFAGHYGDAVAFFKALNFEAHTGEILGQWRKLTQRLDDVSDVILKNWSAVIPGGMITRIEQLQTGVRQLKELGERMIPDALKELNAKLQAVQAHLYQGEWHEIGGAMKSATREAEARLVTKTVSGKPTKVWELKDPPFPPSKLAEFTPAKGWPDLSKPPWNDPAKGGDWAIKSFSGEIKAVKLPPGTKLRRVVTSTSATDGLFWSYTLPRDGHAWRTECAVLESWSGNGFFVELEVPASGLWVWEGKIASQIESDTAKATAGQFLPGGDTQLLIDFKMPAHAEAQKIAAALPRQPTNWVGHMGVNVPSSTVSVEKLGEYEITAKRTGTAAATGARGAQAANNESSP
ncbi:MAG: hypothetical protein M3020_24555 [Myxococcota bacterium]|nr:hypothetical protein [Myxococcota bacterium]